MSATLENRTHEKAAAAGNKQAPHNQVVWFDMPVRDLDRAVRFYSAVLGAPVQKQ